MLRFPRPLRALSHLTLTFVLVLVLVLLLVLLLVLVVFICVVSTHHHLARDHSLDSLTSRIEETSHSEQKGLPFRQALQSKIPHLQCHLQKPPPPPTTTTTDQRRGVDFKVWKKDLKSSPVTRHSHLHRSKLT